MKKIVKNHLLVFALVAVLIIPCLFLFSACGKSETVQVSNYDELVEAMKGDKAVIQLTADIDVKDQVFANRKVTLNLNGKTISNSNDIWSEDKHVWSLIGVGENGDLTVTGNGKFLAKENDCYALDVRDGGRLVVENGEYVGNISAVYVFEGNAEIKGGTYSILQKSTEFGNKLMINIYDANRDNGTANLKVFGGRYNGFDPGSPMENGYKLLAEGYISTLVEGSETDYIVTKA